MQTHPIDARGSFSWLADPGEATQRASVAVSIDSGCIVVDPIDGPGLDGALARCGPVLGVATLLDRHERDAETLAARLAVPRLLPRALGGPGIAIEGMEERTVVARKGWREALLWLPDRRLLVCVETLGTAPFFLARDGDRVGLHPLSRLLGLTSVFDGVVPEAIAVGHGRPLLEDAAPALAGALAHPLGDLPRGWLRAATLAFRSGRGG